MNEQQLAAVKQALEALKKDVRFYKTEKLAAITALQSIISQDALDKKADNARELGLSYDDESKIGCVNHDCDQCKAQPAMHASGLVAIKTLLSRDPCAHAKVAIEMIDEMLKENT